MRVVLKECAWAPLGDGLVLVRDPREALTLADPDGQVAALLEELSTGPATAAELSAALSARGVAVSAADVAAGLDGLDSLGLLERPDEQTLGDPDVDARQFSNLTFFASYARRDQSRAEFVRRVRASRVLVLGAGGVGSSVVQCLAGLGVGAMTIVDRDDVEPRNFARQFLYRHRDVGRSKVARAAEWVREYDPGIEVRPVERWIIGPGDLADLVEDVDLVVGGIDSEQDAHLWVNEAVLRAGVPWVGGGMQRTQFMYFSVDPGRSPCLLCDESDRPDPGEPTSAGVAQRLSRSLRFNNALIGPIAMQLGSLIAYEALRYLSGFEPPRAAGAQVVVDLRTGLVPVWQPFPRLADCPACALAVAEVRS
ncbi:HesA/MoeB/ThiF family protein [Actinophytocola algeriensis]|uniref:Molybdopterin/thiamine biosynthesis adenylyltransferase n=1 Tax=Actinophytocola algeriensis TaxID=1768010 RepID=A0A7W7Q5F3_9PSEU|nr:ThiF family adenylyltransferase [Actinophytocola algeriensis]MBB4907397.1 molybdopterin/thiamine biosynthesis adenylyltransferase [Actinophytocola algeriensis]MBE1479427.1 molybdopterin/thiamine biosynthesis adenylyltransferase [Actinophytocola algeriensis]